MLIGFIYTTRFFTCLTVGIIVLLPDIKFMYVNMDHLLMAINAFLTSLGGFALNDFYDAEKDKINKPYRPIPNNKISKQSTLNISIIFLSAGLLFGIINSFIISLGFTQILFAILLVLYNYVNKVMAIAKTFYTALISSFVILYPILVNDFPLIYFLLPIAAFLFILGKEIFMDILDIEGDKIEGMETLPIKLGVQVSAMLSFMLLWLGTIVLCPLLFKLGVFGYFRLLILFISLIFFILIWNHGTLIQKRKAIIFLWLPMLTGITSILF